MTIASTTVQAEIIETPADESNSVAAPAGVPPTAPPSETPAQPTHRTRSKPLRGAHHQSVTAAAQTPIEVEPARAELPLVATTRVLAAPSPNAKVIKTLNSGTYVTITGSTKAYLQIDTGGHIGYIGSTAVQLVRPAEHIFRL
ncbi:MAG TPA: SH3 domain-containing protein, partial [Candidatus Binataceae bacterium]